jgi:hypothetical protein
MLKRTTQAAIQALRTKSIACAKPATKEKCYEPV